MSIIMNTSQVVFVTKTLEGNPMTLEEASKYTLNLLTKIVNQGLPCLTLEPTLSDIGVLTFVRAKDQRKRVGIIKIFRGVLNGKAIIGWKSFHPRTDLGVFKCVFDRHEYLMTLEEKQELEQAIATGLKWIDTHPRNQ
jgi:hypothetical protein